jgi:hypothetical protein
MTSPSSSSSSPPPLESVTARTDAKGATTLSIKFVGTTEADRFDAVIEADMTREQVSNVLFALSSAIRLRGLGAPGTMPGLPPEMLPPGGNA